MFYQCLQKKSYVEYQKKHNIIGVGSVQNSPWRDLRLFSRAVEEPAEVCGRWAGVHHTLENNCLHLEGPVHLAFVHRLAHWSI